MHKGHFRHTGTGFKLGGDAASECPSPSPPMIPSLTPWPHPPNPIQNIGLVRSSPVGSKAELQQSTILEHSFYIQCLKQKKRSTSAGTLSNPPKLPQNWLEVIGKKWSSTHHFKHWFLKFKVWNIDTSFNIKQHQDSYNIFIPRTKTMTFGHLDRGRSRSLVPQFGMICLPNWRLLPWAQTLSENCLKHFHLIDDRCICGFY